MSAKFEVPDGAFTISDITIDGKPITTGGQLSRRVDVFITVLVHKSIQSRWSTVPPLLARRSETNDHPSG